MRASRDLLVDLDYEKEIGWQFFGWHDELKEKFHCKVEVISSRGLSKYIAPFIHQDKKLLYAK